MGTKLYRRDQTETSLLIGGWSAFLAILIIAIVLITGCANLTVVKLAELCHAEQGRPTVSFSGETGRVDCK